MAILYVWEAGGDSVGHCSLLLDNGTYISWWPKENKSKFKKKKKKVEFQNLYFSFCLVYVLKHSFGEYFNICNIVLNRFPRTFQSCVHRKGCFERVGCRMHL